MPADRLDLLDYETSGNLTLRTGGAEVSVFASAAAVDSGPVVLPAAALDQLGGSDGRAWAMWLRIDDEADPQSVMSAVDDAIASTAGTDNNVDVRGGYVERSGLDQALDIMLLISTGLLGLAVVIALFGVSNTLSLSVVERIRENALLRALGLTRSQQRLMLAAEAALMAIVATVAGLALGIALRLGRNGHRDRQGDRAVRAARRPWQRLAVVAAVAVLAGLIASILPGRRAARVPPAAVLG